MAECNNCGKKFSKTRSNKAYCSKKCCDENYKNDIYRDDIFDNDITRSNIGAYCEHIACSEFIRMGYYVFKHVAVNSPFDIVVYKNGEFSGVEVKSGKKSLHTDTMHYSKPKGDDHDILCVVDITSGEIIIIKEE